MGEALITRRGGGSVGAVAIQKNYSLSHSTDFKTDANGKTLSFDFTGVPVHPDRFGAYVRYGCDCFFTAFNEKAVFEYSGSTITVWFTLSGSNVVLHITATNAEEVALQAVCGFY